jgi:predicted alpha-1,2-mannosidase
MRPRLEDGTWVEPFNPAQIDTPNFTEANGWHYAFFAPHDLASLVEKMGGDDGFVANLDKMFDPTAKIPGVERLADITGVIGMYAHGNEPCHHVAYLYNYAGKAWKTQELVRKVATTLYNNTTKGLCGNDDCGQMSAWYVFSAMGFYPVDPACAGYVLGSPLMDQAVINLDPKYYKGGKFTIIAKDNSPKNMYIQSVTFNGQPYTRSWISQDMLASGGTLVLQMGPESNPQFGAAKADRPGQVSAQ